MKKTNKGFSLVELIIVIAIMAILAGAIAPALIRYIDKSRRSNDVTSCKTIKTAIETALGTEDVYAICTNVANPASDFGVIKVFPNKKTSTTNSGNGSVVISNVTKPADCEMTIPAAQGVIAQNIGEKTPKLKYKKAADGTNKPEYGDGKASFVGLVSPQGTVYVVIAWNGHNPTSVAVDASTGAVTCADGYVICPTVDKDYQ